MEEMTASVVAQQRELELLRATSRTGQARQLTDLEQEVKMDEFARGVAQSKIVEEIVTLPSEDLVTPSTTPNGRPHTKKMDQKQGGTAGLKDVQKSTVSIQSSQQTHCGRVEPRGIKGEEVDGLHAVLVHRGVGTDEEIPGMECDAINKNWSEVIASDVWGCSPGASKEIRSRTMLQLLEWLISVSTGDIRATPFDHVVDEKPPPCGFRDDDLETLRERIQTKLSVAVSREAETVLSKRNNDLEQQRTEWELKEATWRKQVRHVAGNRGLSAFVV